MISRSSLNGWFLNPLESVVGHGGMGWAGSWAEAAPLLSHPWLWRRRASPAGVWMPWPTHPRCVYIPWGPSGWRVSVLVTWSALERMGLGRKYRLAWKVSLRLFGQGILGWSKVPRVWSRSSGPQSFWHQGSVRGRQFTDWGGKGWFWDDSSALHLLWTLFWLLLYQLHLRLLGMRSWRLGTPGLEGISVGSEWVHPLGPSLLIQWWGAQPGSVRAGPFKSWKALSAGSRNILECGN